ncbi:MAG: CBS domain-containing protein [Chitinophagales bacterium]|nr:CBS domain-containing protein [Chitinophagales bacterium]
MKKRTPVSKIMTSNVTSVNVTNSLREVYNLIKEKNINHVPVVKGDEIIGLLTDSDFDKISYMSADDKSNLSIFDALTIEQVMTKNIKTVQQEDLIVDVANILAHSHFHALPVLDGKKLVGIVTTTDLLKFLVDQY